MSIYHCSIKIISRAGGRSAVASAAYRSGERLYNDETGIVHDFTRKGGVVYTEIMLPNNAPTKYLNREILWNEVQKIEKRSDAQFAREVEVAFPKELTREEQLKCVKTFIDKNFVSEGMIADFAIHDTGKGNPHAHIMLTVRGIDENEEWMQKQRTVFANTRDKNGVPIYDPTLPTYDAKNKETTAKYRIPALDKNGKQKTRVRKGKGTEYLWEKISIPVNDWNEHANAEKWRASWAEECNRFLSIANQIDHRSYERQGLEMEPTVHEGITARNMEKKGKVADRCEMNREIKERNILRAQIRKLATEITNIIIRKARLIYERVRELTGHIGDAGKTAGSGGGNGRVTDTSGEFAKREASNSRRNGNLEGRQGSFTGRDSGFEVGKRTVSRGTGRSNKFKQSIQQTSDFLEKSEREIADTDRRIEEVTRQIKKKEKEQNERIRKLMERRRVSAGVGGAAGRDRQVEGRESLTIGVESGVSGKTERLSIFDRAVEGGIEGSMESSKEFEKSELAAATEDIRSFLAELAAKERSSEEKRDDSGKEQGTSGIKWSGYAASAGKAISIRDDVMEEKLRNEGSQSQATRRSRR